MIARDDLRAMLDAIPDEKLPAAREALARLTDPVLLAFLNAPMDDEPLTDEDLAAIAEGKADIARGLTVPLADVLAELDARDDER
jgi:predicted transcriptional regulator